jgi:hypothetical protein
LKRAERVHLIFVLAIVKSTATDGRVVAAVVEVLVVEVVAGLVIVLH